MLAYTYTGVNFNQQFFNLLIALATSRWSRNPPMLKLPDTIRVSEAPGMLPLARVVLIRPVGGMAGVRPALGESVVVAGHIALNVIALPVRDVRLPAPKARQERCEGRPRGKKHDK